jgi:hypothetical protein
MLCAFAAIWGTVALLYVRKRPEKLTGLDHRMFRFIWSAVIGLSLFGLVAAYLWSGRFDIVGTVVGLVVWLAFAVGVKISLRLLMGDHYRKTTPTERRWLSGTILFLPIWIWAFAHIGRSYLDRAGAVGIWLYMMGCGLVGILGLWVWVKFVPAKVSWWLAVFVWGITLWLAVTNRFA